MFDYLQQFNNLPKEIRERVSSPQTMAAITALENKYKVDLAMVVMKITIKSLTFKSLPAYFISELNLNATQAENLTQELKEQVFVTLADYLGISADLRALDLDKDINILVQEIGLNLPSENLISRFKNILSIYLKGIRNKIDTRASLAKDIKTGGLSLAPEEIERIFKVCEVQKFKSLSVSLPFASTTQPLTRLDKIIFGADKTASGGEYNLKQALASGQVKTSELADKTGGLKSPLLDLKHELAEPEKELNLPQPEIKFSESKPQSQTSIKISAPAPVQAPAPAPAPAKPQAPAAAKILVQPQSSAQSKVALKTTPPTQPSVKFAPEKKKGLLSRLFKHDSKDKKIISPTPPTATTTVLTPTMSTPQSKNIAPLKTATAITPPPIIPIPKPTFSTKITIPKETFAPISLRPIAAARPTMPASSSRPTLHDIKPVPKVMGPLEELKFLDLVNFRRLGKTPADMTAKVFMKIKLLEKEGYDKMIAGIKAWRQSPVNKMYLAAGQEALAKGVSVKDLAAGRKNTTDYLSLEEIVAISGLNSKLLF